MKIQIDEGIFDLGEFTTEAVDALCNQYADAPAPANNPLYFLSESRETTVGYCRVRVREMLRKMVPEVGYSLFPLSQAELDSRFISSSGIIEIG